MSDLLVGKDLKKSFPRGGKILKAVDGVSFTIRAGETLGLVGESGSGKSTLGRSILRLLEPDEGEIVFDGVDLRRLDGEALRAKRREMQIVFQDPLASLHPQMSIGEAIADPLVIHGVGTPAERREMVAELLDTVGIGREFISSFPHEFSGGQQQRIGIARALALRPRFIVCDEPVSALDVSIQAQIVALLLELKDKFGLSYLFIAHDLGVIKHVSDRIAVMYLGRIVQIAPRDELFRNPLHPYTKALISAVPKIPRDGRPTRRFETLKGEIPSSLDLPPGCRFHPRCPLAEPECRASEPELSEVAPGHWVACHLYPTRRRAVV
ncbi:MAG: ABC transporter ATP-binding protein [Firmicutes bacterium]|nr:ABC transporter ATP-binding protein [Bacillota bacterium]